MKQAIFKAACLAALFFSPFVTSAQTISDSLLIRKIYHEALSNRTGYEQLRYLSNEIGGRLSGSPEAEKAVNYTKAEMDKMGLDRVYLQEVMVPHWVRGEKEVGKMVGKKGKKVEVPVCALGGSIGTGKKGITAEIIEVKSLEEVAKLGKDKVSGKIIFFNRPMEPSHVNAFHAYGGAVDQRGRGAFEAAKYGAVAVIVRSMNLALDDFPHTGAMRYEDGITKIPAASISTNGAELLSHRLKDEPGLQFYLKQNPQTLPDARSYNVIGEIKGSENPDEIIVVGGHLDSWDLGDGSHDDGAGCVQAIEVLRIMKALNIKPKRTIRAVMFMNEENGVRGGLKYAEEAKNKNENHVAAIESDAGGFTPRGFGISGLPKHVKAIQQWKLLLEPYGLHDIGPGYGGVDINPLGKNSKETALIGLEPDSQRYFEVHHAASDTFDKINQRELALGAASMAALTYLLSEYGL
ncbi:M20/M25/M40 family metallo-hydrolase [Adhaeribacter sp. BT258]|uniref:Carboxypeptidase Q n=1 Tax=Adhaeribacter terrigena TaxID=2793070 RepID=A0ABS1BYX8_9BACT|nr:M20/M25/M40 family metallo-hydrolase [Adhaeribacter terrigena]MBK0402284.1 M20/M25/M40 family metallo-hydrolase [Adhaeribacter terrigena]